MSSPLPVVGHVDVIGDVIDTVIVAVHVNVNDTVIVIDPVDADSSALKPSDGITPTGPITSTVSFRFTCTAHDHGPELRSITSTSTSTITDTIAAPRMTMLRARSNDQLAPGRMTMMRRPA